MTKTLREWRARRRADRELEEENRRRALEERDTLLERWRRAEESARVSDVHARSADEWATYHESFRALRDQTDRQWAETQRRLAESHFYSPPRDITFEVNGLLAEDDFNRLRDGMRGLTISAESAAEAFRQLGRGMSRSMGQVPPQAPPAAGALTTAAAPEPSKPVAEEPNERAIRLRD